MTSLAAAVIRILFVGNSLTFANDLPAKVAELARATGEDVQCEMVALPDFSLEDHWQKGDAVRAIRRGGWTYVVLQQGPSALPESRVLLIDYVKKFDAEIRKVRAKTALFTVWPTLQRRADFPRVVESYALAARAVGGVLLPVGDEFRVLMKRDPRADLYGIDGFHPSAAGTALAARIIADALMNCWYHHC
jgi:hypothetical protein